MGVELPTHKFGALLPSPLALWAAWGYGSLPSQGLASYSPPLRFLLPFLRQEDTRRKMLLEENSATTVRLLQLLFRVLFRGSPSGPGW